MQKKHCFLTLNTKFNSIQVFDYFLIYRYSKLSFHADFFKRPTGDVVFECDMGDDINNMINVAIESKTRQNLPVLVRATVPSLSKEIVASFTLTLSVKVKH